MWHQKNRLVRPFNSHIRATTYIVLNPISLYFYIFCDRCTLLCVRINIRKDSPTILCNLYDSYPQYIYSPYTILKLEMYLNKLSINTKRRAWNNVSKSKRIISNDRQVIQFKINSEKLFQFFLKLSKIEILQSARECRERGRLALCG